MADRSYGTSAGDQPSPTRRGVQLQGPRPSPLSLRKESHKIRKPPAHPSHHPPPPPLPPAPAPATQPVIIYAVSPKVIHTTVSDFMSLVQRLTGDSSSLAGAGDISPAARFASIERTSPRGRERSVDPMGFVEVSQIPGILSPAPATLLPISPGFFSPAPDPHGFSFLHDLHGFSPSTLFSAPIISPSPSSSSFDIFNLFLNF